MIAKKDMTEHEFFTIFFYECMTQRRQNLFSFYPGYLPRKGGFEDQAGIAVEVQARPSIVFFNEHQRWRQWEAQDSVIVGGFNVLNLMFYDPSIDGTYECTGIIMPK